MSCPRHQIQETLKAPLPLLGDVEFGHLIKILVFVDVAVWVLCCCFVEHFFFFLALGGMGRPFRMLTSS